VITAKLTTIGITAKGTVTAAAATTPAVAAVTLTTDEVVEFRDFSVKRSARKDSSRSLRNSISSKH
jgi:hypothetical protein